MNKLDITDMFRTMSAKTNKNSFQALVEHLQEFTIYSAEEQFRQIFKDCN